MTDKAPVHADKERRPIMQPLPAILACLFLAFFCCMWRLPKVQKNAPTPKISWWICPDHASYQCAYFDVPIHHDRDSSDLKVSIFLRKLPAMAPYKQRLGSMLINPGGPGASGSEAVMDYGVELATILQGRYDIIGFDPRGVNMTIPSIHCQKSGAYTAHLHEALQHLGIHFEARNSVSDPNSYQAIEAELAFTKKHDAFLKAISSSCTLSGDHIMLQAVGTASVAMDMKLILEAVGDGERGLVYWGRSYGTILGATFAAMYPELVHRVVLDGVADAISYHQNFKDYGRSGLMDTNKTQQEFFDSCARAGPLRCALAMYNCTSESISDRMREMYVSLARAPIPVVSEKSGTGILTVSDVKLFFFTRLYGPKGWPALAEGLASVERGDGTYVYDSLYSSFVNNVPKNSTENVFHRHMGSSFISTIAIMCGDTADKNMTTTQYLEYVHELETMSPIGQNWAHWQGFCRFWDFEAREIYRGPWSVDEGLKQTKFPILFVSQTGDPVTPLSAARKMVRAFGNQSASLLIQNGVGHCSSSHPSLCTAKKVRQYMLYGEVPEYGATCEVEPGFLFPDSNVSLYAESRIREDRILMEALDRMSSVTHPLT